MTEPTTERCPCGWRGSLAQAQGRGNHYASCPEDGPGPGSSWRSAEPTENQAVGGGRPLTVEELISERDALAASLAKVRELHRPSDPFGECVECTHEIGEGNPFPGGRWDCAHSDRIVPWPCPTIQAIGEATDG